MDGNSHNALTEAAGTALSNEVLEERLRRIVREGTPENTERAYRSDLAYVESWGRASGLRVGPPMSVEDLARFIVDHVDGPPPEVDRALVAEGAKRDFGPHAITTIKRRVAVISVAHQLRGLPNPCVDARIQEILSRAHKAALLQGWKPNKKQAAHVEVLEPILATCGDDLRGIRDRALIMFGFASGGRRRSEVVAAVIERLERLGEDYVYNLGITKTSQTEDSGAVPVAGRAARALEDWLREARISSGPIFRPIDRWGHVADEALTGDAASRIVKARARLAGLDARRFSGHSLRSGFMTETGIQGIGLAEAMKLSGHRSVQVAAGYQQGGSGLRNQAARILG